jgi:hypothetical protein
MKYKEAIPKDYKKLTFYLCLRDEFQYNQLSDWSSDENYDVKAAKHEKKPTVPIRASEEKDIDTEHVSTTIKKSPIFVMDSDDDPFPEATR